MVEKTKINDKIEALYADKKARNFFNHLVRSYYPIKNLERVMTRPTGSFKCIISGDKLTSVEEVMDNIKSEEFKRDLPNLLKSSIRLDENQIEKIGGSLAMTTKDTNTYMSIQTIDIFRNWVAVKILNNDNHITWLAKDMIKNTDDGQVKNSLNSKFKKNKVRSGENTTVTFGDAFESLRALKDKMNKK